MNWPALLVSLLLGLCPFAWIVQRLWPNRYLGWGLDAGKGAMVVQLLKNQDEWVPWLALLLLIIGHVFTPFKELKKFSALPVFMGAVAVLSPEAGIASALVLAYATWVGKPAVIGTLSAVAAAAIAHWVFYSTEIYFVVIIPTFLLIAYQNEKEMDAILSPESR